MTLHGPLTSHAFPGKPTAAALSRSVADQRRTVVAGLRGLCRRTGPSVTRRQAAARRIRRHRRCRPLVPGALPRACRRCGWPAGGHSVRRRPAGPRLLGAGGHDRDRGNAKDVAGLRGAQPAHLDRRLRAHGVRDTRAVPCRGRGRPLGAERCGAAAGDDAGRHRAGIQARSLAAPRPRRRRLALCNAARPGCCGAGRPGGRRLAAMDRGAAAGDGRRHRRGVAGGDRHVARARDGAGPTLRCHGGTHRRQPDATADPRLLRRPARRRGDQGRRQREPPGPALRRPRRLQARQRHLRPHHRRSGPRAGRPTAEGDVARQGRRGARRRRRVPAAADQCHEHRGGRPGRVAAHPGTLAALRGRRTRGDDLLFCRHCHVPPMAAATRS